MQVSRNDFENALRNSFSQQFEGVPRNEKEIQYEFSESFKKRMKKLIQRQKKSVWRMTNTTSKKVVALVAVISLLITCAMSVSAVREPILKFVTEVFDTHIDLSFEGNTTAIIEEEYELTWFPEGFELLEKNVSQAEVITKYRNNTGNEIQLWQTVTQNTSTHFDNEQGEVKVIYVNDKEVLMNMGEKVSFITWIENGYLMDIIYQGSIDEDTMIRMMENIAKQEKE